MESETKVIMCGSVGCDQQATRYANQKPYCQDCYDEVDGTMPLPPAPARQRTVTSAPPAPVRTGRPLRQGACKVDPAHGPARARGFCLKCYGPWRLGKLPAQFGSFTPVKQYKPRQSRKKAVMTPATATEQQAPVRAARENSRAEITMRGVLPAHAVKSVEAASSGWRVLITKVDANGASEATFSSVISQQSASEIIVNLMGVVK